MTATIVTLVPPLEAALAQAQLDLLAAPAGAEQEWRMPPGNHLLTAEVAVGEVGKKLHLRGSDDFAMIFNGGGLVMVGDEVRITELGLQTLDCEAAVRLTAPVVVVSDLEIPAAAGAADLIGLAIDAGTDGTVDLDDVELGTLAGTDATIGVSIAAGTVRAAGVRITEVSGTDVTGVRVRALGGANLAEVAVARGNGLDTAIGADLAALGGLSVADLAIGTITAADATGAIVLGGGDEVRVVDLDVTKVEAGAGLGRGGFIAGGGDVVVRGFAIGGVAGDNAWGLVVAGGVENPAPEGPTVEVAFGTIDGVTAVNTPCAGLRVLVASCRRSVVVRDVAVRNVYGGPVPIAAEAVVAPAAPDPAWATWVASAVPTLAAAVSPTITLPPVPAPLATIGLHVLASFEEVVQFVDDFAAEPLELVDCSVRAVHGGALAVEGGLRTTSVRRLAVDHAMQGGYLQGDRLVLANTTWHELRAGVLAGPGEVHAYDSIFSHVGDGTAEPLALDPDADWMTFQVLHADSEGLHFAPLGATPFRDPGGPVPDPWAPDSAIAPVDLRLVEGSPLHGLAVAPPPDALDTDQRKPFDGAFPPEAEALCDLYDPLRLGDPAAAPVPVPSPVVDYRARDAAAFTKVMMDRARTTMGVWTDRGAADFTTMVIETLAERLDHLAYQQERATAEGFLEDARLRRSIEDHVRPLDYAVDPGLSATTLLQVRFDFTALAAQGAGDAAAAALALATATAALAADPTNLALIAARDAAQANQDRLDARAAVYAELAADGALELPAETMVATATDDRLVFSTEAPLTYAAVLHDLQLDEWAGRGATSARITRIAGGPILANERALADLLLGQWLILRQPDGRGHVIRVTQATGNEIVEIGWDPRRALPFDVEPATTEVLGNLVVAHHGLRVASVDPDAVSSPRRAAVEAILAALDLDVDGATDDEAVLPFHPISVQAAGYPFPGEVRTGAAKLGVFVEGEPWTMVSDLAAELANREVFALRASADGRTAIRFTTATGQSALPRRKVAIRIDPMIGLGTAGNVGADVLTRILRVPFDPLRSGFYGDLFEEDPELLRAVITVTNPLAAIDGREPEPIERIRYRAPLMLQRPLSAVAPEDYVRVAMALPEVAAAHAGVVRGAIRPIVRVTVLLRDEDTLDDDERLRRWALVRKALEDARLLGFDVETVPPTWVPLDLDVVVECEPSAEAGAVRDRVIAAVAGDGGLFDPDRHGLGGDVHLADLYRAVAGARGVASAHVRRFRRLALGAPERVEAGVIAIGADEVAIVRGPGRPDADGVLSVTVCGGLV